MTCALPEVRRSFERTIVWAEQLPVCDVAAEGHAALRIQCGKRIAGILLLLLRDM